MLPLHEELRQALAELRTWVELHRTAEDSDLGIWRALGTVDKAVSFIRRAETPGPNVARVTIEPKPLRPDPGRRQAGASWVDWLILAVMVVALLAMLELWAGFPPPQPR